MIKNFLCLKSKFFYQELPKLFANLVFIIPCMVVLIIVIKKSIIHNFINFNYKVFLLNKLIKHYLTYDMNNSL